MGKGGRQVGEDLRAEMLKLRSVAEWDWSLCHLEVGWGREVSLPSSSVSLGLFD